MKTTFFRLSSLAVVTAFTVNTAFAQLKLGDNPVSINANSLLEMETTNKGLLLPRVALTSTSAFAPLTAHLAGMTVYNTATAGDVTPGHYYNSGSSWVRLLSDNLYTANGTLTGNRTVTMGANSLNFTGSAGTGSFNNQLTAGLQLTGSGTNRADIILTAGSSIADWYVDNNNAIQLAARGNRLIIGTRQAFPITFGTNNRTTDMTLDATGNLGIGTSTPTEKLHVVGNAKTSGKVIIGTASVASATGTAPVVRDMTTGELKVVQSPNGNNKAFTYVTYEINNVSEDWLNDLNTNIPVADYTVIVTGVIFLVQGLVTNTGSYNPLNFAAFPSAGTWRLKADYDGSGTLNSVNGAWRLNILIINNSVVQTLSTITVNAGGSMNASAPIPAGL